MAYRAVALLLVLQASLHGQTLVGSDHLAAARQAFDSPPASSPLRCALSAIQPALNFGLRFQTGYSLEIPLNQYRGQDHHLRILMRVAPDSGEPAYFASTANLTGIADAKTTAQMSGAVIVGEGAYAVDVLVRDDLDRACRNRWRIQARRAGNERDLKPATPPATVEEFVEGPPPSGKPASGLAIGRLTILLHAAPFSPRGSKLQDTDVHILVSSLSSLIEQLSPRSVRLAVFSLDRQKVILRNDDFEAANLTDVTSALKQLQLGVVDYRSLQNRVNPADFLAELLRSESNSPKPADSVILLGPQSILPANAPAASSEVHPVSSPFFYLQYLPHYSMGMRPGMDSPPIAGRGRAARGALGPRGDPNPGLTATVPPGLPDAIEQLVKRMKGETIAVLSPHDLADAIRRMSARIPPAPSEASLSPGLRPSQPAAREPNNPPSERSERHSPGPWPPAPGPISLRPPIANPRLSEPSEGDDDPVDLLMRLRDQVLQHASLIPNHTCVETVTRDRYEPVTGRSHQSCDALAARRRQSDFPALLRLEATDRLRLDVALAPDREIYSWAGASKFEEGDIDELIPEGAMGTGPFASMLLAIFESRGPRFVFDGVTTLDARRVMQFSFSVPGDESHYRVKAGKEWVITGYTGSLLVDARTAGLARLTVRTEELPPATGACETDTTLEYGMVPLGGVDYLLPTATRQRFIGRDAGEAENAIAFSACREYHGESTLTFGDHVPSASGEPGAAPAPKSLPPDLPFTVELTGSIPLDRAAAGDRIQGRLVKPILDARRQTLVAAGALLAGRLMRVETRHLHPEIIVALRWETIEIGGVRMPFSPRPNRRVSDPKNPRQGGLRQRGTEIELPLPSEGGYGVYHFPAGSVAVPAGFPSEWLTAQF